MIILNSNGIGTDDLSSISRSVILNSRQSKRPCRQDEWVSRAVPAVACLLEQGDAVITSVGLNTWELALHLVNILGGRQIIILPVETVDRVELAIVRTIADFRLEPSRCFFVTIPFPERDRLRERSTWPERDQLAVDLADTILPISIRPGGNLERLLEQAATAGKKVVTDYRVNYRPAVDRVSYDFQNRSVNPIFTDPDWRYVIHWTRSSHDAYSGESSFDFYKDLLASDSYPRSAFHTLKRIATDRVIVSSQRFIRDGFRVVSFSSLNPLEATKLMRWRRRYVYYSFEPYGVAIQIDAALSAGLRPVIYGDEQLYDSLSENDRPFFQNRGSDVSDWRPEAEWRFIGDLHLQSLPAEAIRLITYTDGEAVELQRLTDFEVTSLITD